MNDDELKQILLVNSQLLEKLLECNARLTNLYEKAFGEVSHEKSQKQTISFERRLVKCQDCGHVFLSGSSRPKCSKCNSVNCIEASANDVKNNGSTGKVRVAHCLVCNHEWYPRSTSGVKPFKCSRCNSRNVVWVDQMDKEPQPEEKPEEKPSFWQKFGRKS